MTRSSAGPLLVVLAVVLIGGACGPTAGAGGSSPSAPAGGAVLVAADTTFDRAELDVPAGVAFPLQFENREASPHNVTIVDEAGRALFVGDIVSGPASRTYRVGPLSAGSYRFRCDVHPSMSGTVIAG